MIGRYYRKYKEVLLYLFFGGLTTVVGVGSFVLFYQAGINELIANLFSWILAVTFAYVTNSIWVFEARPAGWAERLRQMAGFFGGRLATLAMEEAVLAIGVTWLHGNAAAVKILAQILVLIGNYIISKWIVFRK